GGECRAAFDPGRPRTFRGCRVVGGVGLQSWLRWIAPSRREVGRCRGHREAAGLERGGIHPGEPHRRSRDGRLGAHRRRAAQGVSAAAASPATFTLLTTTHAEGPERTRAIAVWTAVSLAGGGLGNIASGLLTDLISWRATLLINLPIGAGVVIAVLVLHRRTTEQ